MRDFFKSWRRKVGVVTLGVACVFGIGMARSLSKVECILVPIGNSFAGVVSIDGGLGLGFEMGKPGKNQISYPMWQTRDFIALEQFIDEGEPEWHRQYLGFHALSENGDTVLLMFAPYWSIVLSLTLISALLLLSKPRPASAVKTTEPVPATGT